MKHSQKMIAAGATDSLRTFPILTYLCLYHWNIFIPVYALPTGNGQDSSNSDASDDINQRYGANSGGSNGGKVRFPLRPRISDNGVIVFDGREIGRVGNTESDKIPSRVSITGSETSGGGGPSASGAGDRIGNGRDGSNSGDKSYEYISQRTGLSFDFSNKERQGMLTEVLEGGKVRFFWPTPSSEWSSTDKNAAAGCTVILIGMLCALVMVYVRWRKEQEGSIRPRRVRRPVPAFKTFNLNTRSNPAESVHIVQPRDRYESIVDHPSTSIQEPDDETPGVVIIPDSTQLFFAPDGIPREGGRIENYSEYSSIHSLPVISIPPPIIADDGPSTGDVSGSFSLTADLPPAYEDVIDSMDRPPAYSSALVQEATNLAQENLDAHGAVASESKRSHKQKSFHV